MNKNIEVFETLQIQMHSDRAKEIAEMATFDEEGSIDVQTKEIETIEELEDNEYFVYPAHDLDFMMITTRHALELMWKGKANPTIDDLVMIYDANSRLADEKKIPELLKLREMPFFSEELCAIVIVVPENEPNMWYFDNNVSTVTLFREDVGSGVVNMVTNWLRSKGVKIAKVKYGSPLHNVWNHYVGD